MKGNLLMQSVLACAVMQAPVSYAGAFHTIIGPDGRPMVVQLPDQAAPPAVQNALPAAVQEERLPEPSAHLNPAQAQKIQQALKDLEPSSSQQKLQQKTQSVMLRPQAALAPSIKPLQAAGYSSALPAAAAPEKTATEPHAAQALQKAAVPAQQGNGAAESAEPEKKREASFRVLPPELVQHRPEAPQPAQQSVRVGPGACSRNRPVHHRGHARHHV